MISTYDSQQAAREESDRRLLAVVSNLNVKLNVVQVVQLDERGPCWEAAPTAGTTTAVLDTFSALLGFSSTTERRQSP